MPETNKTKPEVFFETAGDKIGNYLKKTEARHGTFLNYVDTGDCPQCPL